MPDQTPDEVAPAWSSGARVGRYRLLTKLATGGMAEIWLARQFGLKGFEKVVVVKRILDSFASDPSFVEMFLDEARIVAQLNHHHIVQVYDLGKEAGAYYIAMEYLAGESLAAVIKACRDQGGKMPPAHAARLIAHAAEGLAYAHEKRALSGEPLHIVHRDISPQNLIISFEGILKIVDFGIAKAAGRATRTATGFMKGKLVYASPEQVRGEEVDARSDIFALGVVLYECLTGKRLFQKEDPTQTLRMLLHDTAPLVQNIPTETKAASLVETIVARALERNLDRRYQNARAMQAALEDWLRKQPEAPNPGDISMFMQMLFREKSRESRRFLDTVAGGRPPDPLRDALPRDDGPSTTGETPSRITVIGQNGGFRVPVGRRNPRVRLALIAGAILVAFGTAFGVRTAMKGLEPPVLGMPPPLPTALPLREEMVHVSLDSKPPAANVFDGDHALGQTPLGLSWKKGVALNLRFDLKGYAPETRTVTPQRDYDIDVALAPMPVAKDDVVEPLPPSKTEPKSKRRILSDAPADLSKPGLLTLRSEPWCDALLDGVPIGATPVVKVTVPAGIHRILLRNEAAGVRKEISIVVKPGEESRQSIAFPMGKLAVRVDPWADVSLDGKTIGKTPIEPFDVGKGRHEIRLINGELGKDEKRVVTIKEGVQEILKVTWK